MRLEIELSLLLLRPARAELLTAGAVRARRESSRVAESPQHRADLWSARGRRLPRITHRCFSGLCCNLLKGTGW